MQDDIAEETGLLSPVENTELFGHDAVEQQVLKDYQSGRMPHAIVLTGPDGIGKASFAYRLARFLFIEGDESQGGGLFGDAAPPTSLAVSSDNPIFHRIVSGGHADLMVVERPFDEKTGRYKQEIPVDEVRKIPRFLHQTSAEGGWRIVIIDGAETLNRNAQNALLKILEEPPKKALIVLTSSKPGMFLPTIRSRCRFLAFDPLSEDIVMRLLQKNDPGMSDSDLKILSKLADGSIGQALRLQNEGGIELYQKMIEMLSAAPNIDMVKIHEWSDKLGRKGAEQSYQTTMQLLCWWLARLARAQSKGQMPTAIVDGEDAIITKLTTAYGPKHWLDVWDQVNQTVLQTDRARLDKRQAVLSAFQALVS